MKYKHKKQHSRAFYNQVEIRVTKDQYGNLTLTASLAGYSKTLTHIAEHAIPKLSAKLAKELVCCHYQDLAS